MPVISSWLAGAYMVGVPFVVVCGVSVRAETGHVMAAFDGRPKDFTPR